jgi:tetratricopeptide (TPR) repeat protein
VSARAQRLFEDAVQAYQTQLKTKVPLDLPLLERKFRAAAEADPSLAEATYNLGVLAERQGRVPEAVKAYQEALTRRPGLRQAAEALAVVALNAGDEQRAEALLAELAASSPDDASSRARLAELHRRRGDLERALALAREALFRDPRTLAASKTMIAVYLAQRQYPLARLIALRSLRLDAADPELYQALGLISLAEKEPAKARAQFKKAVEVRPDFLPAHAELVTLAFAQEDYQGAERHLRAILQASGKNSTALLDLGVAYKGMGDLDRAVQAYDQVQQLDPELPEQYFDRGLLVALKGDPEKALALFKTFVVRKGGPGALAADHPVHGLIDEQQKALQQREEERRMMEQARQLEEAEKRQDAERKAVPAPPAEAPPRLAP